MATKKDKAPKVKKEKKVRAKGEPQAPIQWFADAAAKTQDADKIKALAQKEEYSDVTISIQCGRLRKAGLLPPLEKAEKKTATKVKASKKAKTFHPVPKPGQSAAA